MPYVLRPLDVHDDLEDLTSLIHRAYAPLGALGLNYTAVDQTVETTAERCADGECWVAVDEEGAIVGTATLTHPDLRDSCVFYRDPSRAVLNQVAVEPSLQGSGVGTALVEHVASRALELGYRALALDTAVEARHLIDWYRRLRFEVAGVHQWEGKRYRSVLMERLLD